jgi:hypothetical protein
VKRNFEVDAAPAKNSEISVVTKSILIDSLGWYFFQPALVIRSE